MCKIVVGEDNVITQQVIEAMLEGRCSKLWIAGNYAELLQYLKEESPDLLLLDYHLDKDANEGIAEIRAINKTIPIYILSADAEPAISRKMKGAEVAGFLQKPLNLPMLEQIMRPFSAKVGEAAASPVAGEYLANLKTLLGHNPERLQRIVKIFIEEAPSHFAAMQTLIDQKQWPQLKALVHRVRASYGYLGLQTLHQRITQWETDIEHQRNTESYPSILQEIKSATEKLIEEIRQAVKS
ncbi:MAG: response regulator [Bacteroidetes bacterium]|nr:response regulator [Bacteroidota bacterium]